MRTRYLDDQGRPKYTNRLVHEQSPYLRQHAHNPVNWFPWGEAAFNKARAEDKPIFLSIGYSTCHWCHVMEYESFDNERIAALLNKHFVSIKLDREQHPALDDIYMIGVQCLTGQGGWPMSNFLNADGEPFHAGTYYPHESFAQLLAQLHTVWQTRRQDLMAQAKKVTASIRTYTQARSKAVPLADDLTRLAAAELLARLDHVHGGFGGAPKFPNESQLLVLLASARRFNDQHALAAVTLTLGQMSQGGIYDQICGGFHRYTVDAEWLVPHFEKMLYNQAQLVSVYAQAYSMTNAPAYRRLVDQTINYLRRDLSDDHGAFYSATDADSGGAEGRFFVWQRAELKQLLVAEDFSLVSKLYQITEAGNFEGANILNLSGSLASFAARNGWQLTALLRRLDSIHQRLYDIRENREHPLRDEKIITAWNGMMISSLVQAAICLEQPSYGKLAAKIADSIWQTAYSASDGLWRISLAGQVSIRANLEDYAYLAEAMLNLHIYGAHDEANKHQAYLHRAKVLIADMLDKFWDAAGGFYISHPDAGGPMISRSRSPMDGAMPSANAAAMSALVLLYEATGDPAIASRIDASLASFAGLIAQTPSAFPYMLGAVEAYQLGNNRRTQLCAAGNIRVTLSRGLPRNLGEPSNETQVWIHIAEQWHINGYGINSADRDDGDNNARLISTEILHEDGVIYPPGDPWQSESPPLALNVYRGSIRLLIPRPVSGVKLRLQACRRDLCLAPITLSLEW